MVTAPHEKNSTANRSAKRGAPPSCDPQLQLEPADPNNLDSIRDYTGCNSRRGSHSWSAENVLDAFKQGIEYSISPGNGASRAGVPKWQYATKAAYPHVYSNLHRSTQ